MKGVHYVLGHPFSMSMDWTPEGEGSRLELPSPLGEGAAKRRVRGARSG